MPSCRVALSLLTSMPGSRNVQRKLANASSVNRVNSISPYPISANLVKLVIDASIGVKTVLQEHNSSKALQLREDFRHGIHQLFAPDLYFLEIGNVLVSAARNGKIPATDLPLFYADLNLRMFAISS